MSDLVIDLSVHTLIPDPISPSERDGIEPFVRRGRRGSGGSRHAWGDARPDRALVCVDCDARFIRASCCYQSHTLRALWAVAYLTNELQVNFASGEKRRKATDAGKTYAFQTEMGCHVKIRAPARGGFNGAT